MPKIIKESDQMIALRDITKMLEDVKNINDLLWNRDGKQKLFVGVYRSKVIQKVFIPSGGPEKRVEAVLRSEREKKVREIRAKAKRYDIEFDDEEKLILNGLDESQPELDAEPEHVTISEPAQDAEPDFVEDESLSEF